MKLSTLYYKLKTDRPLKKSQIPYLRGYILNNHNNEELHNHSGNGYIYTYPKIQYKIVGGNGHIIGIEGGAKILGKIALETKQLELNHELYDIVDGHIILKNEDFGICESKKTYKFISPWLALNEKNYKYYKDLDDIGKKEKLEKILIGNILSMSKYLNYTADEKIVANILNYKEFTVNYKGNSFIGIIGEFTINFDIPNLFGIGRKVSKGFGTIMQI